MRVRPAYYLVSSLNWFANVLPMAVSVLLAQSRGLTLTDVGLFMGAYALTVVVLELPSGALADAVGRKRVFLAASALQVVAKAVFLTAFGLPAFVLYGLLAGAARALASGALEAWFIDALQAEEPGVDLQPALAAGGAYNLAALAAGTAAGAYLPTLAARLPLADDGMLTPLSSTVAASLALQVAVLALTAAVIHDPRSRGRLRAGAVRRELASVVRDAQAVARGSRVVQALLGVDLVVGAAVMSSETFWQPFFAARLDTAASGPGTFALGAILAGSFLLGVVGNLVATPVSRLLRGRHALTAALFQLLQAAALLTLARQADPLAAAGLFWLTYLARAAWSSPHQALYNAAVPGERRSVMLSLSSLSSFAGGFLGSVMLGPLAQAASIGAAWTAAAVPVALTAGLYLTLSRRPAPDGPRAPGAA